jgi:uncharacterized Zn finger protein
METRKMFSLETTRLEKAIQNAKALHPKVRMIQFGKYQVSGSRGNAYTVKCYRLFGEKIVECSCPTKDGVACKHAVSALPLHLHIAAQRVTA